MVANFIFSKVNSLDNYKALKSPLLVTYYLKLFQFLPILFIAFPHANEECETKHVIVSFQIIKAFIKCIFNI